MTLGGILVFSCSKYIVHNRNIEIIKDLWELMEYKDGYSIIGYHGTDFNITFPSVINNEKIYKVSINGNDMFPDIPENVLISLDLSNSIYLETIGNSTFKNCNLKSIKLPNSINYIGDSAFFGCISLNNVKIPNSVNYIGSYAFSNCTSLDYIAVSKNIANINEHMFSGCSSLKSIIIPDGIISISKNAFSECNSLKNIVIPNSVISIGDLSFSYCNSLEVINISHNNNIKYIGNSAFFYCNSLKSIIIPNSVTYIGNYAFSFCNSLENIIIPNKVASIGYKAFYKSGLKTITLLNKFIELSYRKRSYYGIPENARVYD